MTPDPNEQEFLDASKEYFFDAVPEDFITEEDLEEYYSEWQQRQELFSDEPNNLTFEGE